MMYKKLTLLAVLAFSGTHALAGYMPYGVQEDVDFSTVTNDWGWDLIYRDNYNVSSVSVEDAFAGHGDYVMLGAIKDGSATIEVLAAVAWDDFIVHTAHNETHQANGAEWYNNGGSLGFAGLGDSIKQNEADTSNVNADQRLSWHTDGGSYIGQYHVLAETIRYGWRAGEYTGLNADSGWDRLIFSTNSLSVPEPASIALFGLALAGFGLSRRKK